MITKHPRVNQSIFKPLLNLHGNTTITKILRFTTTFPLGFNSNCPLYLRLSRSRSYLIVLSDICILRLSRSRLYLRSNWMSNPSMGWKKKNNTVTRRKNARGYQYQVGTIGRWPEGGPESFFPRAICSIYKWLKTHTLTQVCLILAFALHVLSNAAYFRDSR